MQFLSPSCVHRVVRLVVSDMKQTVSSQLHIERFGRWISAWFLAVNLLLEEEEEEEILKTKLKNNKNLILVRHKEMFYNIIQRHRLQNETMFRKFFCSIGKSFNKVKQLISPGMFHWIP